MTAADLHEFDFWVTRSRRFGALLDEVQIWLSRPERVRMADGDVCWLGVDTGDMSSSLIDTWSVDECQKQIGTIPEDDRQCICSAASRRVGA